MLTDEERELLILCEQMLAKRSIFTRDHGLTVAQALYDRLSQTGAMVGEREVLALWFYKSWGGLLPLIDETAKEGVYREADRLLSSGLIKAVPGREEIAEWLFNNFPHDPNAKPTDPYWPRKADSLIAIFKPKGSVS